MKKKLVMISLCWSYLIGSPGCMDNSFHLTKIFDYKSYHYVACNCPCEKRYKILANRGQCTKCLHYRDPKYSSFLKTDNQVSLCLEKSQQYKEIPYIGYPKKLLRVL